MSKATIKEVAAEAEVSTATVSRVLNESGYVSDEVKVRVKDAVEKLNYRPSAIARSLKQDRTHMIGIIVPDISNPFFMGISRGIEDVVDKEGFQLMFCSSDDDPVKEKRLLQLLREKRVDAIVLATSGDNDEMIGRLAEADLPIVLIDRKLQNETIGSKLDLVLEDNEEGSYRLTKRLLNDGHVRIGVVNGPIRVSTARERYSGVMQALREHGLSGEPLVYNGEFSTAGGRQAVRKFLSHDPPPTAIISLNNRMSLGVMLEIVRNKLHIPGDIAVASFGEVEAGPLLRNPGLYYIDQQPYEMGIRTGEILLGRIRKEDANPASVCEIVRHKVNQLNKA